MRQSLLAILNINNTNLLHLNMECNESVQVIHVALQHSIENWGELLIAMGGSLKPDKCFTHQMDFAWTKIGGWQYVAHHEDITAAVTVPIPDRMTALFTHQAADNAQKTLGVVTCPSGNSKSSLLQMKE
jgi:hypothetical protein